MDLSESALHFRKRTLNSHCSAVVSSSAQQRSVHMRGIATSGPLEVRMVSSTLWPDIIQLSGHGSDLSALVALEDVIERDNQPVCPESIPNKLW